ncbi:MAG: hypothetical protein ACO1SX_21135 [Actinomycetota bacterium]
MRVMLLAFLGLALCGFLAVPCAAQTARTRPEPFPGIRLAEGVTQLTGVAISPLMGVSAVGAWHYFRAPEAPRPHLPWYAHPAFWGCGLFLVSLSFLKDAFEPAIPHALKKPLDALDLLQSQVSGFLATVAFVPSVVGQVMEGVQPGEETMALGLDGGMAHAVLGGGLNPMLLLVPVAIAGFLAVWLTFHTINVFILLSPWGLIDSALKLLKGLILATLIGAAVLSPVLGGLVALVIVITAVLAAPWAMRFTVFGSMVAFDLVRLSRYAGARQVDEPRVFLARRFQGRPTRTYGRLLRGPEGEVLFRYRPWYVLAERTMPISEPNLTLARGLLCPSLCYSAGAGSQPVRLFILMPRFRGHEDEVAMRLGIPNVIDGTVVRGLRAIQGWWKETLGLGIAAVQRRA